MGQPPCSGPVRCQRPGTLIHTAEHTGPCHSGLLRPTQLAPAHPARTSTPTPRDSHSRLSPRAQSQDGRSARLAQPRRSDRHAPGHPGSGIAPCAPASARPSSASPTCPRRPGHPPQLRDDASSREPHYTVLADGIPIFSPKLNEAAANFEKPTAFVKIIRFRFPQLRTTANPRVDRILF